MSSKWDEPFPLATDSTLAKYEASKQRIVSLDALLTWQADLIGRVARAQAKRDAGHLFGVEQDLLTEEVREYQAVAATFKGERDDQSLDGN